MTAKTARKITVEIPEDLLERALAQTQQNITETIRQGLKLLAESSTYSKLKAMKGKGKFQNDWKKLKEDR